MFEKAPDAELKEAEMKQSTFKEGNKVAMKYTVFI